MPPFDERLQWVEDNEFMILSVGKDPKGTVKLWGEADSPFMFVAACIEYYQWVQSGRSEAFVSYLPVALDGSNSGLQHYSAAMRSAKEASFVSLLPCEIPADLYQTIADHVVAAIEKEAAEGDNLAYIILQAGVGRKTVKRNGICFAYSSEQFGFRQQLMDDLMRPLFSGTLTRSDDRSQVRILAVPMEELIVPPSIRCLRTTPLIAHRQEKSKDELIAEGFDRSLVSQLSDGKDNELETDPERLNRLAEVGGDMLTEDPTERQKGTRKHVVYETYARIDADGTGSKLWKVIHCGSVVLDKEQVARQLSGYRYDMNGTPCVGVIADEVQAVLPELVIEADDERKTLSVAYGNLAAVLIEAVKALKAEVAALKEQLA